MKFRKYLVYFLFLVFCIPTGMAMTSCQPSYRNMRKFSKTKKAQSKRKKSFKKKRRMKQQSTTYQYDLCVEVETQNNLPLLICRCANLPFPLFS